MRWSGHFELVEPREIASGGYGKVFRAKLQSRGGIRQDVILKTPYGKDSQTFRDAAATMEEEARILAMISHPNIVRSSGFHSALVSCAECRVFGQHCDHAPGEQMTHELPVLVLEDAGTSLEKVLQMFGGRMDEARAAHVAIEVLRGLGYLHEQGIVHRDIKPSNILIGRHGEVKLGDLGIAKDKLSPKDTTKLGHLKGTIYYMAPEAMLPTAPGTERIKLDGRADIWAVGVLLYKLVSGRFPWHVAQERGEISFYIDWSKKVESEPITELPTEQMSQALFDVINTCLAKNRDERFEDTAQVIQALQSLALPSRWYAAQELAHHARSAIAKYEQGAGLSSGPQAVTVPVRGGRRSESVEEPELVSLSIIVPPDMHDYSSESVEASLPSSNEESEVTAGVARPERTWRAARATSRVVAAAAVAALVLGGGTWLWRSDAAHGAEPKRSVGAAGTAKAERRSQQDERLALSVRPVQSVSPTRADVPLLAVKGRSESSPSEAVLAMTTTTSVGAGTERTASSPPLRSEQDSATDERQARASVGSLEVVVLPAGALVSLDSQAPVRAPVTFQKLKLGAHSLRLGLSAEALDRVQRVKVRAGANRVRIELAANPFGSD